MQDSRLFTLLRTLDRYEMARLRKLLCSPFFNHNEEIVTLFDELRANYLNDEAEKSEKSEKSEKNAIWLKIKPPKEPFNDLKFRQLCSDLLKLCEAFLVQKQLHDEGKQDILLLRQLQLRKLTKHFESAEQHLRKRLELGQKSDFKVYYSQFELEEIVFQHRNETVRSNRKTNLEDVDKNLTISFLVQKLNKYCTALNYKSVSQIEVTIAGIDETLALAALPEYCDVPLIAVWRRVIAFLTDPTDTAHYYAALESLTKNADLLETTERNDLYAHIMNYCIRKINANQTLFYTELFNLYKLLLAKKYIFNNNILNYWDYKNIVTVALHLKEYDWANDFIKTYKEFIAENWRENAFTYNMAKLQFAQANYGAVIKLLQTVDYQDIFYTLDSKITLLKTYYLLEEYDALHSLLESFRIFLLRDKQASVYARTSFTNFGRYLKRISNLNRFDRKGAEKLRQAIESHAILTDKKWLLAQL